MSGHCCNFAVLLMAIFLVIAYTTPLQYPIVVDDYGHNDYRNYDQPYTKYNQPYAKQNEPYAKYVEPNARDEQPYAKYEQPYAQHEQPYAQHEQPYSKNNLPYSKFDRPIIVKAIKKPKDQQDFSKIPGTPGVDFPLYHTIPRTSFSCAYVPFAPGMYANVETGCQVYHICHDGREGHQGASFLCPNGTIFSQREFSCDWWYNVKCAEAIALYSLNLDPEKNPYLPKKKKEEPQKNMRIVVL
ncbi:uncharacterized protein LOC143352260 [Halictus rubicundus]|uniref:uncharacterized protein LOC143352260 n=1 Tax=Halictus rubicundus TaxID=77578 RepID=UPI004036CD04